MSNETQKQDIIPSEEFLVLAETIADIKTRFERVESEFSTQAKPLEAAGVALNAAVSGLRALQTHVLDQSITTLSQRLESTRAAIDEQIGVVVAELKKADDAQLAKTDATAQAFRAEIAELGKQLGKLTTQFGSEIARVSLEAKAQIEKFAAVPPVAGKDGKAINPTGSYAADKAYQRNDLVSYMGGSFVSNIDDNREKPGNKAKNWTQIASRGGNGGGGITSVEGIPGINANVVQFLKSPSDTTLGTAVGSKTGSGAVVFATTPTSTPSILKPLAFTTPDVAPPVAAPRTIDVPVAAPKTGVTSVGAVANTTAPDPVLLPTAVPSVVSLGDCKN